MTAGCGPLLVLACLLQPAGEPPKEDATISLPATGGEAARAATPDLREAEKLIVERTNAFRKGEKRSALSVEETLSREARAFARFMAEMERYGHEADGRTPAERVTEAGYEVCIVRENIAYAFRTSGFATQVLAEQFLTGWKASPGHRENMLARHVTETGVGIAKSEASDTYLAVQLFGRPRSAAIAFEVANETDATVTYRLAGQEFPLPPRVVRTHELCAPERVTFLPTTPATEEPATRAEKAAAPVARFEPEGGERFVAVPGQSGYRVEVRKEEDFEEKSNSRRD